MEEKKITVRSPSHAASLCVHENIFWCFKFFSLRAPSKEQNLVGKISYCTSRRRYISEFNSAPCPAIKTVNQGGAMSAHPDKNTHGGEKKSTTMYCCSQILLSSGGGGLIFSSSHTRFFHFFLVEKAKKVRLCVRVHQQWGALSWVGRGRCWHNGILSLTSCNNRK